MGVEEQAIRITLALQDGEANKQLDLFEDRVIKFQENLSKSLTSAFQNIATEIKTQVTNINSTMKAFNDVIDIEKQKQAAKFTDMIAKANIKDFNNTKKQSLLQTAMFKLSKLLSTNYQKDIKLKTQDLKLATQQNDTFKNITKTLKSKNQEHENQIELLREDNQEAARSEETFRNIADNVANVGINYGKIIDLAAGFWQQLKIADMWTEKFITSNYRLYGSQYKLVQQAMKISEITGVTNEAAIEAYASLADVATPIAMMDKLAESISTANVYLGLAIPQMAEFSRQLRLSGGDASSMERTVRYASAAMKKFGLNTQDVQKVMTGTKVSVTDITIAFGKLTKDGRSTFEEFTRLKLLMGGMSKQMGYTAENGMELAESFASAEGKMLLGNMLGRQIKSMEEYGAAVQAVGLNIMETSGLNIDAVNAALAGDEQQRMNMQAQIQNYAKFYGISQDAVMMALQQGKELKAAGIRDAKDFEGIMKYQKDIAEKMAKEAMDPMAEANRTISRQLAIMANKLNAAIAGSLSRINASFVDLFITANKYIDPVLTIVSEFITGMAEGLEMVMVVLRSATSAMEYVGATLRGWADQYPVLYTIAEYLQSIGKWALRLAGVITVFAGVAASLVGIYTAVSGVFSIASSLFGLVSASIPVLFGAGASLSTVLGPLLLIPAAIYLVYKNWQTLVDVFNNFDFGEYVKNVGESLLKNLTFVFKNFIGFIMGWPIQVISAFNLGNKILESVVVPMLKSLGLDVIAGFAEGWIDGWKRLTGFVMNGFWSLYSAITGFFGIASPSKLMLEVGTSLIQGLWDGIKSIPIVGNVLGIFSDIYTSITEFFGISSPSKIMESIGGFIIEGLWQGISMAPGISLIIGMAKKIASWFGAGKSDTEKFTEEMSALSEVKVPTSIGDDYIKLSQDLKTGTKTMSGVYAMLPMISGVMDGIRNVAANAVITGPLLMAGGMLVSAGASFLNTSAALLRTAATVLEGAGEIIETEFTAVREASINYLDAARNMVLAGPAMAAGALSLLGTSFLFRKSSSMLAGVSIGFISFAIAASAFNDSVSRIERSNTVLNNLDFAPAKANLAVLSDDLGILVDSIVSPITLIAESIERLNDSLTNFSENSIDSISRLRPSLMDLTSMMASKLVKSEMLFTGKVATTTIGGEEKTDKQAESAKLLAEISTNLTAFMDRVSKADEDKLELMSQQLAAMSDGARSNMTTEYNSWIH